MRVLLGNMFLLFELIFIHDFPVICDARFADNTVNQSNSLRVLVVKNLSASQKEDIQTYRKLFDSHRAASILQRYTSIKN